MNCFGLICVWMAMGNPWVPLEMIRQFSTPESTEPVWQSDYALASTRARLQQRQLLIHFTPAASEPADGPDRRAEQTFVSETLADPLVAERLGPYVLVRLPRDAEIRVRGQRLRLLEHPSFAEMHRRPGLAIVDYRTTDPDLYGRVVSTFPFTAGRFYQAEPVRVILDLPEGTLTQRTMVYAVRMHPEAPESTAGELHQVLAEEAAKHSQYQAEIGLQGHHRWDQRFHQINARLASDATSQEVCAESWPGETLVEAAVECVRCWRLSPGHWSAVRRRHALFGYDIRRGGNGVWYATGIFANFRR